MQITEARVLVTGGAGFIGRELVRTLCDQSIEVHVIGRSSASDDRAHFHHCDLLARDTSLQFIGDLGCTHLAHMAWYTEPGEFWNSPRNLEWVEASLRLVRAFVADEKKRIIVAGTCAEYDWTSGQLDEKKTALVPATLYGETKASLFHILTAAAAVLDYELAWGRVFIPFGPGEPSEKLLGTLLRTIETGEPAFFSSGVQERDFMYVPEIGRAFARLLFADIRGPVNIASGESISVRSFVEQAAEIGNVRHLVNFGKRELQKHEPPLIVASTARLYNEIGFEKKHSLQSALQQTIEHYQERNSSLESQK
jgi:nucleoside-diphosphate-sugar epimerase